MSCWLYWSSWLSSTRASRSSTQASRSSTRASRANLPHPIWFDYFALTWTSRPILHDIWSYLNYFNNLIFKIGLLMDHINLSSVLNLIKSFWDLPEMRFNLFRDLLGIYFYKKVISLNYVIILSCCNFFSLGCCFIKVHVIISHRLIYRSWGWGWFWSFAWWPSSSSMELGSCFNSLL